MPNPDNKAKPTSSVKPQVRPAAVRNPERRPAAHNAEDENQGQPRRAPQQAPMRKPQNESPRPRVRQASEGQGEPQRVQRPAAAQPQEVKRPAGTPRPRRENLQSSEVVQKKRSEANLHTREQRSENTEPKRRPKPAQRPSDLDPEVRAQTHKTGNPVQKKAARPEGSSQTTGATKRPAQPQRRTQPPPERQQSPSFEHALESTLSIHTTSSKTESALRKPANEAEELHIRPSRSNPPESDIYTEEPPRKKVRSSDATSAIETFDEEPRPKSSAKKSPKDRNVITDDEIDALEASIMRTSGIKPVQEKSKTKTAAKEPAKKSKAAKIYDIASTIFVWVLSIAIVGGSASYALSTNTKRALPGGFRLFNVLTTSMTPQADSLPGGFYAGDMIVVKVIDPEDIEINDIITFYTRPDSDSYLTHRVIGFQQGLNEVEGLFFLTRGDANNSDDPPIPVERLVGKKVFTIPKLGSAIKFVRGNLVASLAFFVSLYLLIITLKYYFQKPQEPMLQP